MIRRHGLFLLSCLLAFTGGHMFNYTVILYLQETVGSELLSGLGFGLAFGSSIVFGWFAGALCDRVAPGRVIHGAQALFLVGLGCLWWAEHGGVPSLRIAFALLGAFAGGLAWSFAGPARLATLGQIAATAELRPLTILFNLQVLVGFGLAPLVIGLIRSRSGWAAVEAVAAALFVAASALLLGLRTYATASAGTGVRADIAEGFAAVGARPLLRQLMLAAVIAYALTGPLQILLPRLARGPLGLTEAQRGAYLGLLALSLIAGGVLALALARRLPHGRVILGGIGAGGLLFAALASVRSPAASALLLACVGLLGGMVISLVVSGIQAQAPPAARGRVMAMYSIVSQVLPALSGMAAGALLGHADVATAITACGLALAALAGTAALGLPVLRRYTGSA
ncbi:MAG: MFS transporter [Pseudomonadota bacterium]